MYLNYPQGYPFMSRDEEEYIDFKEVEEDKGEREEKESDNKSFYLSYPENYDLQDETFTRLDKGNKVQNTSQQYGIPSQSGIMGQMGQNEMPSPNSAQQEQGMPQNQTTVPETTPQTGMEGQGTFQQGSTTTPATETTTQLEGTQQFTTPTQIPIPTQTQMPTSTQAGMAPQQSISQTMPQSGTMTQVAPQQGNAPSVTEFKANLIIYPLMGKKCMLKELDKQNEASEVQIFNKKEENYSPMKVPKVNPSYGGLEEYNNSNSSHNHSHNNNHDHDYSDSASKNNVYDPHDMYVPKDIYRPIDIYQPKEIFKSISSSELIEDIKPKANSNYMANVSKQHYQEYNTVESYGYMKIYNPMQIANPAELCKVQPIAKVDSEDDCCKSDDKEMLNLKKYYDKLYAVSDNEYLKDVKKKKMDSCDEDKHDSKKKDHEHCEKEEGKSKKEHHCEEDSYNSKKKHHHNDGKKDSSKKKSHYYSEEKFKKKNR